jgi:hypothetical protein
LVVFELKGDVGRPALVTALKTYPGYCPITEHAWAILSDKTPKETLDHLQQSVPAPSRLFVVRSGTAAAWTNSFGTLNDAWLKKNL